MLRNKRGAMSLRWLEAILDADIEVHGQIVCCPDVNNGGVLEQTLSGVLDRYEKLASIAVVPLGVSKFSPVDHMRPHTVDEARDVVDIIERWQTIFKDTLGHRMVFAADEYYLRADLPFPSADSYDDVDLHEDGIGMAVTFGREFRGETDEATSTASGFFSWVEGAPAEGYRAPRTADGAEGTAAAPAIAVTLSSRPKKDRPIAVLTGTLGAQIIEPLIAASEPQAPTRVIAVENEFFGGNVGVTGLMVGADLQRVLAGEPEGDRYLLPDVCLSNGRFLDGLTVDDLPRPVEVITTDGISLRKAIGA
jgi:NifB/MoaA-like Fe-S oxidoreductase